jgi:hypothetical protein
MDLKNEIINKSGFLIYTDYWEKYFSKMSGEQIKEVFKIIFCFNKTFEILKTNDLAVEMVVATIIDNIKRDAEKRFKQSIASKENGKLGGRPKKAKPKQNRSKTEANNSNVMENHNIENNSKGVEIDTVKTKFDEFWSFYTPVAGRDGKSVDKGNKADAKKSYEKAITLNFTHEKIMQALEFYLKECQKNARFTKHAVSWLNQATRDEFKFEQSSVIQSQAPPQKLNRDQEQDRINEEFLKLYAKN